MDFMTLIMMMLINNDNNYQSLSLSHCIASTDNYLSSSLIESSNKNTEGTVWSGEMEASSRAMAVARLLMEIDGEKNGEIGIKHSFPTLQQQEQPYRTLSFSQSIETW